MRRIAFVITASICAIAAGAESSIPVDIIRGRVAINAYINGNGPFVFLLDSALPQPVIDSGAARTLVLAPLEGAGIEMPDAEGNLVAGHTVEAVQLRLGDVPLEPMRPAAINLSPLTAILGATVSGMLDVRHLGDYVTLDLPRERLVVGGEPHRDEGIPLDFTSDGAIQVTAVVDGEHPVEATVDLAYGGWLSIPVDLAETRSLIGSEAPRLRVDAAEPDSVASVQVRLKSLRLGPAVVEDPLLDLWPTGGRVRIGTAFLKQYSVSIDWTNKTLHIDVAGGSRVVVPPIEGTGLTLKVLEGRFWTVHVAEGSPAFRSGVRTGYRLKAVNGQSMEGAEYASAMESLSVDVGETVRVTLEGPEGRVEVQLDGKRLL